MKNVVIIGAGPAGLTAAYTLLKGSSDINVTILEWSDSIGGISRTAEYKGNRIDIGGHRFFSKDKQIMKLWQDIMPLQTAPARDDIILGRNPSTSTANPDIANPEKTDNVMLIRRRVSRIYFMRKFFDYPISLKPRTFINMGFVNTVKAGIGYISSSIHKLPETSLENFYINRFGKPLYSMFFEGYTEKVWGVHPSKIAADWGAQRVKGLSVRKLIASAVTKPFRKKSDKVETSLIEEFYYPKFGPGQLWERMAQLTEEMGGVILKNTAAVRLTASGDKITFITAKNGDREFDIPADYVISSMAIKDLISALPVVPRDIYDIAYNLPYRDFITVGLLLDKLEIKNSTKLKTVGEIVPDCWIYIQERSVKVGRLQIFNNWSPYMVKDFENTVWVGMEYFCNEGDSMWNSDNDEFIKFAADELASIGIIDKAKIRDSYIQRVKKAYPAYFGTYAEFDKVREYLDSYTNLYCIGRNGQHRYNNMDHSMLTAINAAECILSGNPDKTSVWNVNTEKEYHETKINNGQE